MHLHMHMHMDTHAHAHMHMSSGMHADVRDHKIAKTLRTVWHSQLPELSLRLTVARVAGVHNVGVLA